MVSVSVKRTLKFVRQGFNLLKFSNGVIDVKSKGDLLKVSKTALNKVVIARLFLNLDISIILLWKPKPNVAISLNIQPKIQFECEGSITIRIFFIVILQNF